MHGPLNIKAVQPRGCVGLYAFLLESTVTVGLPPRIVTSRIALHREFPQFNSAVPSNCARVIQFPHEGQHTTTPFPRFSSVGISIKTAAVFRGHSTP